MGYAYEHKRRGAVHPSARDGAGTAVRSTVPNSTRLAALEAGQAAPSAAEKGRRVDLPEAMRAKMENAFGMDFSGVKLYESAMLGQTNAEAMARGNEIAFAPGKLDFASQSGQALLGHELSHVAAQARGQVCGGGFLLDSGLEHRADMEGAMAARGEQIYGGGAVPLSNASAAPMAGPMQAKKPRNAAPQRPRPQRIRDNTPVSPEWQALQEAGATKDTDAIKTAYSTIAQQQSENVTDQQFDAVNDYIADSRPINGYLRGNQQMDDAMKAAQRQKVNLIDEVMENNRLGADVTTYRGVSDVALATILKNSGDKKLSGAVNKDGSIDHKKFAEVRDRLKGVEYTDTGFGSTSVNEQFAEDWRRKIINRDVRTKEMDAKFKKYKNSDTSKRMINEVLKRKGVSSFAELDNETQYNLKSAIGLTRDKKIEAASQKLKANMGSHLYEIHAPKGAKATMIDYMRKNKKGEKTNASQQELLVGRNARYKISDILPMMDEKGQAMRNQYRIIMELLNEEEDG